MTDEYECSTCHEKKPRSEFYDTRGNKRGFTYVCKECSRKSANESRKRRVKKNETEVIEG